MARKLKKSAARKKYAKPYLIDVTLLREEVESFEKYPFSVPAISKLEKLTFHPDVTFFVGENGTGKSTLLEGLATRLGLNPGGGNLNNRFQIPENSITDLHAKLRIGRSPIRPKDYFFLRAESYFNLASNIDELDKEPSIGPRIIESYGGKSLHEQSHGESFMALLANKLRGDGLYLFDEPEAALSPQRQLSALAAIHELVNRGSQFIIATHSPILLSYPNSKIYSFDSARIAEVMYEQTEHYFITKDYLNNYSGRLVLLLDSEDEAS